MLESQQRRIVARKLARELGPAELDAVAGGVTRYYNSAGEMVYDTNHS